MLPYSDSDVLDAISSRRGNLQVASIYLGATVSYSNVKRNSFKKVKKLIRRMVKHENVNGVMLEQLFNINRDMLNSCSINTRGAFHSDGFIPMRVLVKAKTLLDDGIGIGKISQDLGLDRNVLTKRLIFHDMYRVKRRLHKSRPNLSDSEILEAYSAGESLTQLAKDANCTTEKISNVLTNHSIRIRGRVEQTKISGYAKRSLLPEEYTDRQDIRRLTELVYSQHEKLINRDFAPRGRSLFHLDHKISILDYHVKRHITIWEICHPANLQILCCKANSLKAGQSCISKKQLLKDIRQWDLENGDAYYQINHPLIYHIAGKYYWWDGIHDTPKRRYATKQQWRTV